MTLERLAAVGAGALLLTLALRRGRQVYARDGTLVDVLAVYLGLWGAVLLLFAIPLIAYTTTPFVAWVGIYGAIASGAVASLVVYRHASAGPVDHDAAIRTLRASINPQRLRLIWAISGALGVVGLCAFVYAVDRVIPWTAVLTDPQAVRETKRDSSVFQDAYGPWKLLIYFNQVAFVVWTIGLRLRAFSGRWRTAAFVGAASILPFLLTADRGLLVTMIIWAGLLHLMWPGPPRGRRTIVLLAVGIVLSGAVVTAIGNRYGGSLEAHPEIAAQVNAPAADPFVIPYLYLTANLPTFGQLTQDHLAPVTAGQMSVLPLEKVAVAAGLSATPPVGTGSFYAIPFEAFSNYSWLGTFWLDFRLLGVLVLPAIVLALVTALRVRALRAPSIGILWVSSLLLYVVVVSPFANGLTNTVTWQLLVLAPVVAFPSTTVCGFASSDACRG